MKLNIFLLVVFGAFQGCGPGYYDVKAISGPSGEQAYFVRCWDMLHCYESAARQCGAYTILNKDAENYQVPLATGGTAGGTTFSIMFKCGR